MKAKENGIIAIIHSSRYFLLKKTYDMYISTSTTTENFGNQRICLGYLI